MFGKLKNLFADKPPEGVDIDAHPAHRIEHDRNGQRIYHEFFVPNEADLDGRWHWLARVYSSQPPREGRGTAVSSDGAQAAALAWCEQAKRSLRGN